MSWKTLTRCSIPITHDSNVGITNTYVVALSEILIRVIGLDKAPVQALDRIGRHVYAQAGLANGLP